MKRRQNEPTERGGRASVDVGESNEKDGPVVLKNFPLRTKRQMVQNVLELSQPDRDLVS